MTRDQKKKNKVPFTLRLCPQVLANLRREAEKTGLTFTRIIESALRERLATKRS